MFKVRWVGGAIRPEHQAEQAKVRRRVLRELKAAGMKPVGTDAQGFELWSQDPGYKPSKARLKTLFGRASDWRKRA